MCLKNQNNRKDKIILFLSTLYYFKFQKIIYLISLTKLQFNTFLYIIKYNI